MVVVGSSSWRLDPSVRAAQAAIPADASGEAARAVEDAYRALAEETGGGVGGAGHTSSMTQSSHHGGGSSYVAYCHSFYPCKSRKDDPQHVLPPTQILCLFPDQRLGSPMVQMTFGSKRWMRVGMRCLSS